MIGVAEQFSRGDQPFPRLRVFRLASPISPHLLIGSVNQFDDGQTVRASGLGGIKSAWTRSRASGGSDWYSSRARLRLP